MNKLFFILALMLSSFAVGAGEWKDQITPSKREFRVYVPTGIRLFKRPVLVALHGCLHSPEKFDELAGLSALAEREKIYLVLPRQKLSNNPTKCWNWYSKAHQKRGTGEPKEIMEALEWTMGKFRVDESRIYVGGISAGGGMTSILLAQYPEVFAAGMVASGTMYKAAENMVQGKLAADFGSSADPVKVSEANWQELGRSIALPEKLPVLVFHGVKDRFCNPKNAPQVVQQFFALNDLMDDGLFNTSPTPLFTKALISEAGVRYTWSGLGPVGEEARIQLIMVEGMGHAWSGGKVSSLFNFAKGPNQTELMWSFFKKFQR